MNEVLLVVFVTFVMVYLVCIMVPIKPDPNRTCGKTKDCVAVDWGPCDKCNKWFPIEKMHETEKDKYLCVTCHGLVKIYMDNG